MDTILRVRLFGVAINGAPVAIKLTKLIAVITRAVIPNKQTHEIIIAER